MDAILRVNGKIPRRAVLLPDGGLGDRVCHRDLPEVELLSRLCELARGRCRQPVYPRMTAELVELALRGDNSPGVWGALRDDLLTGDFDREAAAAVLRQGSNAATMVACLVGARDANHMLHVACVLSQVVDLLDSECRAEVGRALACQLRGAMDAIGRHGSLLTREIRDGLLDGLGCMLGSIGLPDAHVAEAVLLALTQRRDELLRLFLHMPVTFLEHRPQLLPALLDRAQAAAAAGLPCYPTAAMLANVARARPEVVRGCETQLACMACTALSREDLDVRDCLAVVSLLVAAEGAGNGADLNMALASALQRCCSKLMETLDA